MQPWLQKELSGEQKQPLQKGRDRSSRRRGRRPRWERRRGSQANVRIWMENYQYPGRHLPNICFSICLRGPGGLKPAAFSIHVNEYFSSYSWKFRGIRILGSSRAANTNSYLPGTRDKISRMDKSLGFGLVSLVHTSHPLTALCNQGGKADAQRWVFWRPDRQHFQIKISKEKEKSHFILCSVSP